MKKTMIFAAVAAMFVFASCQKEGFTHVQNAQPEELVFTATIDQSATKTTINTDGTDATNRGKIEWVAGDEITITDAESTSVVYVAETGGTSVSFTKKAGETKSLAAGSTYSATYKAAPATVQAYADYYSAVNQAKDLYMTAPSTSGTTLSFTAACGLLKLNLTASGENTKDISKIEIVGRLAGAAKDTLFALTCDNESIASAKDFYIALPAGSYDLMKFTNSKGSVCFKNATAAMAIEANKIQPVTLSGITFSALLPGKFTVASGKQVQFSAANLWCNTSGPVTYSFESAQNVIYSMLGQTTYTADHVCHFFWVTPSEATEVATAPWAETFGTHTQTMDDKFWCGVDDSMTIDGQSGLYALTGGDSGEWNYLFNSRSSASSLYKYGVSVTTSAGTVANCVVIAPDGYTGSIASSYDAAAWAVAEASGLVCLPATGLRQGSGLSNGGSNGEYWSATPSGNRTYRAYRLSFYDSEVNPSGEAVRGNGISVRLVYSAAPSAPVYPEAPGLACVKIGDVWWAPVNCGYDATHPYGLLYQWGRKYGQGYDSETPAVSIQESQLTTVAAGSEASNKDNFYCGEEVWTSASTSETDDWFTTYNPCPDGWRVPTSDEFKALLGNQYEVRDAGWDSTNKGYWLNGTTSPSTGNGLFFPAAGCRSYYDGEVYEERGVVGYYWSTSIVTGGVSTMGLYESVAYITNSNRADGVSVRCVQE